MGNIVGARAYANNEVAYISWDIDGHIEGCLGFEVVRVYLDEQGQVATPPGGDTERVTLAAWVGFSGQRNPHWLPQTTSVWPIQKLSWRDLTLRKRRSTDKRRPDNVRVRYEIRPLGDLKPGLQPAPDPAPKKVTVTKRDAKGRPIKDATGKVVKVDVKAYTGAPRPLGYLGPAVASNDVLITRKRGVFQSTFTNGILAAQWLRNVIWEDGVKEPDEIINMISDPANRIRKYLAGDVIPLLHDFFARPGAFLVGLYELEDEELVDLLLANKTRIKVVLANTSAGTGQDKNKWDLRNAPARQKLINAGVDVQHRMFNNSVHIGHNKFVVNLSPAGEPTAVFTGSTNWTSTGLAGQSNNAIVIEDANVAKAFDRYFERMQADALDEPNPLSNPMPGNQQGAEFRKANASSETFSLPGGVSLTTWFSPNMPNRKKPSSNPKTPPDLLDVYSLMRRAEHAILFLAFYPSQSGRDSIIGKAIEFGIEDRKLIVTGAVSSPQAMPNYVPAQKNKPDDDDDDEKAQSPHTFQDANVSIIRASRIDDESMLQDFGVEELTAKKVGAIIHDKLVVIDPLSKNCAVILGSHNLGFKASYSNDENMVIVRGDRDLAQAYAVHILDVYDHYRFRAVQAELARKGKEGWSGFLSTDDKWLEGYVNGSKGALMRYFARGA